MRIQNITYALCMAATANAVRLESTTQLEAENFGDWLEEHFKIEIGPYGLAQVNPELDNNELTQLAQLGSTA